MGRTLYPLFAKENVFFSTVHFLFGRDGPRWSSLNPAWTPHKNPDPDPHQSKKSVPDPDLHRCKMTDPGEANPQAVKSPPHSDHHYTSQQISVHIQYNDDVPWTKDFHDKIQNFKKKIVNHRDEDKGYRIEQPSVMATYGLIPYYMHERNIFWCNDETCLMKSMRIITTVYDTINKCW